MLLNTRLRTNQELRTNQSMMDTLVCVNVFSSIMVITINSNQCLLPSKPEVNVEKELNSHSFYAGHNFSHSLKLISIDLF